MRQRYLWTFGLFAALLSACATGSRVTRISYSPIPQVKISYSPIEPGEPGFMETASVTDLQTGISGKDGKEKPPDFPDFPDSTEPADEDAKESLPTLGAPISTKEALTEALARTTEGLLQYKRGEMEAAHESLVKARLIFLEVALPDDMKTRGLGFFQSFLPKELRRYDPEEIAEALDRADRPRDSEMAERALVEKEVRSLLSQFGYATPEERYAGVLIKETQQYIQFYRGDWRRFFERSLLRQYKYWPTIREVFTKKRVPLDFGYLALVESGFRPQAKSHANALGVWQFIPTTGKEYGLETPEDFADVRLSTAAAAAHLLQLNNIFGSNLLALAAYNAGEGKVRSCLRKLDDSAKRGFWEIRGCLRVETQQYVPRVLAVAVIGTDPKRFGFDLPTEEEMRQHFDVVVVPRVTSLDYLASLAGVKVAFLRETNTELGLTATNTPGRNFPLYVPFGTGAPLLAALTLAPEERRPSVAPLGPIEMAVPGEGPGSPQGHKPQTANRQ